MSPLAVNNTIEARDGRTGALLQTYTYSSNVTSFDATTVPEPSTLAVARHRCHRAARLRMAPAKAIGIAPQGRPRLDRPLVGEQRTEFPSILTSNGLILPARAIDIRFVGRRGACPRLAAEAVDFIGRRPGRSPSEGGHSALPGRPWWKAVLKTSFRANRSRGMAGPLGRRGHFAVVLSFHKPAARQRRVPAFAG